MGVPLQAEAHGAESFFILAEAIAIPFACLAEIRRFASVGFHLFRAFLRLLLNRQLSLRRVRVLILTMTAE
jgi:hypothetical protein